MIQASRIASGLADDLPKIASPTANPKALIQDAFRRGCSARPLHPSRLQRLPDPRPSLREGGASWAMLIDPPDPCS